MERSKGKLEVGLGDGNDSLFSKSPHQNKASANGNLVAICYKENAITNAEHLIECWNAYEEGGLVDELKDDIAAQRLARIDALELVSGYNAKSEQLQQQRDELLEAHKKIVKASDRLKETLAYMVMKEIAEQAITKAKEV